jgi:DeoR family transcriptional regulator, fructose operon transcriptional repressor
MLEKHVTPESAAVQFGFRHRRILEIIERQGTVRTKELATQLQVSEMTIRRDLDELGRQGHVRRVHGGATLFASSDKLGGHEGNLVRKQTIARAALRYFPRAGTVYLDAGSTSMELARVIHELDPAQRDGLRIVTHAPGIATHLATHRLVRSVHQIGDDVNFATLSAVGPHALEQILGLHFDVFFMGVRGADPVAGWTNNDSAEAKMKQAVMSRSSKIYVIADSSKWRALSFTPIAPFEAATGWVVDRGQQQDMAEAFRELQLELCFA